jgi:asparagine synthase (glutamine-hydrolysing)
MEQVGIAPEPDPLALAYALVMRYVPAPLAIWKGCAKLEAGHHLVWSRKTGLRIQRYWEPPTEICMGSERSGERWQELFHEVLSDHLLADVPIGIFLSGGLDSTALAGGLKKIGYSAAAISASLPESAANEFPTAAETARKLGFLCKEVEICSADLAHHQADLMRAFDEPEVDCGPLPMFLICRQAKQDFKVVFGGDGGDECFAGYRWYHPKPASNLISRTSRQLRRLLRRKLWQAGLQRRDPLLPAVIDRSNPFSTADIVTLFAGTGLEFNDEVRVAPFRKHFEEKLPRLRGLQRMDLMTFCSDLCLLKVDRASMFNSLEVRVPFLDRRVLEWALSSPVRAEENQAEKSKPLLRRYVEDAQLGHVLKQPKSGFGMKGSEFRTVSQETIRQIDESWLGRSGLLCAQWRNVISGENGIDPRKLWLLMQLSHWLSYRLENLHQESGSRMAAHGGSAEAA